MLAGLLVLLWLDKSVQRCYKDDDADKFLSDGSGDCGGEDYERLLRRDTASQSSDNGRTAKWYEAFGCIFICMQGKGKDACGLLLILQNRFCGQQTV